MAIRENRFAVPKNALSRWEIRFGLISIKKVLLKTKVSFRNLFLANPAFKFVIGQKYMPN
jgi:hypothetical protein